MSRGSNPYEPPTERFDSDAPPFPADSSNSSHHRPLLVHGGMLSLWGAGVMYYTVGRLWFVGAFVGICLLAFAIVAAKRQVLSRREHDVR